MRSDIFWFVAVEREVVVVVVDVDVDALMQH